MSDIVSYKVDDKIALIKINRADKMNALNEDVMQGLRNAFRRYDDSEERCAILCAEGDRAFSVGADIKSPPKEMWREWGRIKPRWSWDHPQFVFSHFKRLDNTFYYLRGNENTPTWPGRINDDFLQEPVAHLVAA